MKNQLFLLAALAGSLLVSCCAFGGEPDQVDLDVRVVYYGSDQRDAFRLRVNRNVNFGEIKRNIRERIGRQGLELVALVYGQRAPLDAEPLGPDTTVHVVVRPQRPPVPRRVQQLRQRPRVVIPGRGHPGTPRPPRAGAQPAGFPAVEPAAVPEAVAAH